MRATCNEVMYDPALCWIRGMIDSPQLAVVPFCRPWASVSQSLKTVVEFFETFDDVELAVQLTIRVSPGPKTVPAAGLDQYT